MSLIEEIKKRVLLFDGAMGTQIQALTPEAKDFLDNKEGFNDSLIFTRPDWIKQIHRSYLDAGADCVETNSFGSNKLKLEEYGKGEQTIEFNLTAAKIAREVCNEYKEKKFVIGSMGPTGYLPSSNDPDLGQISLDTIQEAFELQAEGLIKGGADALLIETSQDILEVKVAVEACKNAKIKLNSNVAIIANVTLDQYGKMLLGTNVQSAYTTVSDMGIDIFGLNCSTGPTEMEPSIRWLNEQDELPILVVPNAGMPINEGGKAVYKMTPHQMRESMNEFMKKYPKIRIIGGCCGTDPNHIKQLKDMLDSFFVKQ